MSFILDKPHRHAHSLVMESNENKSSLEDFILHRMRMSHIYQPVMLKVLLENNGTREGITLIMPNRVDEGSLRVVTGREQLRVTTGASEEDAVVLSNGPHTLVH